MICSWIGHSNNLGKPPLHWCALYRDTGTGTTIFSERKKNQGSDFKILSTFYSHKKATDKYILYDMFRKYS